MEGASARSEVSKTKPANILSYVTGARRNRKSCEATNRRYTASGSNVSDLHLPHLGRVGVPVSRSDNS